MFNEYSGLANEISKFIEESLIFAAGRWEIHYIEPVHDIARRFLNEIVEFEPAEEIRRSSLKPWKIK